MEHGLALAGVLFALGLMGLLVRRNILFMLMSLEIMMNSAALAFVVAGSRWQQPDGQIMFILILTGVIFVGTGIALFWFLWKYDAAQNAQPVAFTHGSHTLEVVWSIIPAAALVFIAIYQMNAWADAKMRRPTLADGRLKPEIAEVTGRQFEWRIRYAGKDGIVGTEDDVVAIGVAPGAPVRDEPTDSVRTVGDLVRRRQCQRFGQVVGLRHIRTEALGDETRQSGAGAELKHTLARNEARLRRNPASQGHR